MNKLLIAFATAISLCWGAFLWATVIPSAYQTHYHANFAVYIRGERVDFSAGHYMEEVSRCNVSEDVRPQDRVHLHDNIGDVVHVHVAASTWWDLFANLYWSIGKTFISDNEDRLYTTNTWALYYFLNGELIENPANIPIQSEDRLLVWYGTGTSQEVHDQFFPKVATSAIIYNQKDDPASCASNIRWGFFSRLRELFPHEHK